MSLKKTALATIIALSLTACGSSGGGSSSPEKPTNITSTPKVTPTNNQQVELTQQVEKANQKITQLEQTLNSEKSTSADKVKKLTEELNQAKTELKIAQSNANTSNENAEKLAEKANIAQQKMAQIEAELNQEKTTYANKVKQLNDELEKTKKDLVTVKTNLTTSNNNERELTKKVNEAQKKIEQLTNQLSEIEKQEQAKLDEQKKQQEEKEKQNAQYKAENAENEQRFVEKLGNSFIQPTNSGFIEESRKYQDATNTRIFTNRIYNQQYSVIYGETANVRYYGETYSPRFNIKDVGGNLTNVDKLPSEGKATYKGIAFGAFDKGDLTYTIDFANKTGKGKIQNLADIPNIADVILEEGKINGNTIQSTLQAYVAPLPTSEQAYDPYDLKGRYILGIYGPNAEEIAGKAIFNDINQNTMRRADYYSDNGGYRAEIGFGGTRGEIQK